MSWFLSCAYVFKNKFKSNFKNNFKSMTWNDPLPVISEGLLGGLALSHLQRLTLVRRTKITIVWYISTFVQYINRRLTTDTHFSQPLTSCHQLQSPTSSHHPQATNLQQRQNGCTFHMFGISWRSIINWGAAKFVFIKICLMQKHSSGLKMQVSQQAPSCRTLLKPYAMQ